MEQEEYIVDGHKVTHSVHLGDREIFLAVQQDAPLPFYVGYREVSYELGLARFSGSLGAVHPAPAKADRTGPRAAPGTPCAAAPDGG